MDIQLPGMAAIPEEYQLRLAEVPADVQQELHISEHHITMA